MVYEMGHALGLDDACDTTGDALVRCFHDPEPGLELLPEAVMAEPDRCDLGPLEPNEDDLAGLQVLYGAWAVVQALRADSMSPYARDEEVQLPIYLDAGEEICFQGWPNHHATDLSLLIDGDLQDDEVPCTSWSDNGTHEITVTWLSDGIGCDGASSLFVVVEGAVAQGTGVQSPDSGSPGTAKSGCGCAAAPTRGGLVAMLFGLLLASGWRTRRG